MASSFGLPESDLYDGVFGGLTALFLLALIVGHIGIGYFARKKRLQRDPVQEATSEGFSPTYMAIFYGAHSLMLLILSIIVGVVGVGSHLAYHTVVCDIGQFVFFIILLYKKLGIKPLPLQPGLSEMDSLQISVIGIYGVYILVFGFPFGTSAKVMTWVWFSNRGFCLLSTSIISTISLTASALPTINIFIPLYIVCIPLLIIPCVVLYFKIFKNGQGFPQDPPTKSLFIKIVIFIVIFLILMCFWVAATARFASISNLSGLGIALAFPSVMVFWIPLSLTVCGLFYFTVEKGYFLLFLPEWMFLWCLLLSSLGTVYNIDRPSLTTAGSRSTCSPVTAFVVIYTLFTLAYTALCLLVRTRKRNVFYEIVTSYSEFMEADTPITVVSDVGAEGQKQMPASNGGTQSYGGPPSNTGPQNQGTGPQPQGSTQPYGHPQSYSGPPYQGGASNHGPPHGGPPYHGGPSSYGGPPHGGPPYHGGPSSYGGPPHGGPPHQGGPSPHRGPP